MGDEQAAGRCPVCGTGLAGEVAVCARCDQAHHSDSVAYAERCARSGCGALSQTDLQALRRAVDDLRWELSGFAEEYREGAERMAEAALLVVAAAGIFVSYLTFDAMVGAAASFWMPAVLCALLTVPVGVGALRSAVTVVWAEVITWRDERRWSRRLQESLARLTRADRLDFCSMLRAPAFREATVRRLWYVVQASVVVGLTGAWLHAGGHRLGLALLLFAALGPVVVAPVLAEVPRRERFLRRARRTLAVEPRREPKE